MRDFTTSWHCLSRAHCDACRNDPAWCAAMAKAFVMPEECPHVAGLGDVVAKALKLPGVRQVVKAMTGVDTRAPCSGCRKRQAALNRILPLGKKD